MRPKRLILLHRLFKGFPATISTLVVESEIHFMLLLNYTVSSVQLLFILEDLALEPLYDLFRFLIEIVEVLELVLAHTGHLLLHLKYLSPLLMPLL
jgi:hypothetical protein